MFNDVLYAFAEGFSAFVRQTILNFDGFLCRKAENGSPLIVIVGFQNDFEETLAGAFSSFSFAYLGLPLFSN